VPDGELSDDELSTLYRKRFDDKELATKRSLWQVLCETSFQQYVPQDGTVVDLGAGNCEFINEIKAARRIAVDLNQDTKALAAPGVEVLLTSSENMSGLDDGCVDTVFTSNFFEHVPTKALLLDTLRECRRITRPGGRIVVLMPNIRYVGGRYWDYFDHHLPLTHESLAEALELTGYEVEKVVPKFLPYTVKDAPFEVPPLLIRLYLKVPLAWRFLGKQMLVIARNPG
jgi:SAM-dependent methyltransferase